MRSKLAVGDPKMYDPAGWASAMQNLGGGTTEAMVAELAQGIRRQDRITDQNQPM